MRRIINDDKGEVDKSKVFWLVFWLILLVSNLCIVDHLSSMASSLRIMSQVSAQPTLVVPSTVTVPAR